MLGRFLELSVETKDIGASIAFYEQLGFTQCATGDTWSHPYGVVTDGRLAIGLHEYHFASPSLTFVHAEIAKHANVIEAAGITLAFRRTSDDTFNEIGFRDPTRQMVTVLEARTFSPSERSRDSASRCGDFAEFSLPASNFAVAQEFWERCGFVATEEMESPYRHLPLTSDHLNLAFHAPRFHDRPLLVFDHPDPHSVSDDALIESPEGLALLLRSAE